MKGILKIYHPEETLKYNIDSSYCKAVYLNKQNFLEVEIITDDSLDHVDDDSLHYNFPQLSLKIMDFPIDGGDLEGKSFEVNDTADEIFTETNLYCDEDAFIYNNKLDFSKNGTGDLQVIWSGEIDDFYTGTDDAIPFKLKCHFRKDKIVIDD